MRQFIQCLGMVFVLFDLTGCASTQFARTSTPVTIKQVRVREGLVTWGGPRIFRFNNVEIGYSPNVVGTETYSLDPGKTKLTVWYCGHNPGDGLVMMDTTDLLSMDADLRPSARYELSAHKLAPDRVEMLLTDLATGEVVTKTESAPIVIRANPTPTPPSDFAFIYTGK